MKRYHHGNLRAVLIDAGLTLIEEKGVKSFTLREIGIRAGVSRMAAYRHFSDKADLLRAICEAGFIQFAAALEVAYESAGSSARSRLDAMGLAYVRFAAEHRAHYAVMFGDAAQVIKSSAAADRSFAILVETIQQGQASREFRAGNPVTLAQLVWAAVHGISTLHLKDADFVSSWQEMLMTGLAAPRTGLPTPHSTLDSATQPTK